LLLPPLLPPFAPLSELPLPEEPLALPLLPALPEEPLELLPLMSPPPLLEPAPVLLPAVPLFPEVLDPVWPALLLPVPD